MGHLLIEKKKETFPGLDTFCLYHRIPYSGFASLKAGLNPLESGVASSLDPPESGLKQ
jgi:hypothetical protein